MNAPIRVGIVGVGAIARDHHVPSIASNPAFVLVATVSRHARVEGVANFASIEELLAAGPVLDAVAICTPPQTHYAAARTALLAGKHVLLEKPPCTSLLQFSHLKQMAADASVTLYQAWHSQHGSGVTQAAGLLKTRAINAVRAVWKEDVRRWHPGQTWIWEAGGFGVFDPGINAISILTTLIEEPLLPGSATLFIPSNCQTPIAAKVMLTTPIGMPVGMDFDFRHTGEQTWDIEIDTEGEAMRLSAGGGSLFVGGRAMAGGTVGLRPEYESIYRHFEALIAAGRSEADERPLALVADIFLTGKHEIVEPYVE